MGKLICEMETQWTQQSHSKILVRIVTYFVKETHMTDSGTQEIADTVNKMWHQWNIYSFFFPFIHVRKIFMVGHLNAKA